MISLPIFDSIKEALNSENPFIYLKKNTNSNDVLPFDKIHGIISDMGDKNIYKSGYPHELIRPVDMSFDSPNLSYNSEGPMIYFASNGYDTEINVLEIIKLFNCIPSKDIIIYLDGKIFERINDFANDNIKFEVYKEPDDLNISVSVVLTHGYSTRAFIRQKIPIIVLGPYGLGGWVTPDNIGFLFKRNFKGRPGGNHGETIPLEVLVDELVEIKDCKDINTILQENERILTKYISQFHYYSMEKVIEKFSTIFLKIMSPNERELLKPYLASNVKILENQEYTYAQRDITEDVLFSLPKDENEFVKDLNAQMTCSQLQRKYEMQPNEFWETIMFLWDRKAIIFK
ncbi:MAG: hypothetical protein AAGC64_01165 [Bacteroidota bacterium]